MKNTLRSVYLRKTPLTFKHAKKRYHQRHNALQTLMNEVKLDLN